MVLTTVLSMMRYVSEIEDRDFVDRLSGYYTTNFLIGLSVLVSFKQFGGKPIECLTPDIFSGSWEEYAENYCWAQDTYFVPPQQAVEGYSSTSREQRRVSYYQWVPFFLLAEAACFRLPSLLWKYMSGQSGIKIREIVKLSSDPNNIKPEIKRANIHSLTVHLQGALRFHRRLERKQIRPHRLLWPLNLPYSACYVSSMYLATKFSYLANVGFQLALLNNFLGTHRYPLYGFGALLELLNGVEWAQSGMFPRVTLCDFQVRVMGNVQEHTIQCVLVINLFNEKIFVLLWFWYACVAVLTLGSLLYWLTVLSSSWFSRRFIVRHMEMSEMPFDESKDSKAVDYFVNNYLRQDGMFVLRMLTLHFGVIFGTEMVVSLWRSYYGIEVETMKRSNSEGQLYISDDDDGRGSYGGGGAGARRDSLWAGLKAGQNINPPPLISNYYPPAFGPTTRLANDLADKLIPPLSPPSMRDVNSALLGNDSRRSSIDSLGGGGGGKQKRDSARSTPARDDGGSGDKTRTSMTKEGALRLANRSVGNDVTRRLVGGAGATRGGGRQRN